MERQEIKEMLEKQMRLLSEHSEKGAIDLAPASHALCELAYHWARYFTEEGQRAFAYYGGEMPTTVNPPQDAGELMS